MGYYNALMKNRNLAGVVWIEAKTSIVAPTHIELEKGQFAQRQQRAFTDHVVEIIERLSDGPEGPTHEFTLTPDYVFTIRPIGKRQSLVAKGNEVRIASPWDVAGSSTLH